MKKKSIFLSVFLCIFGTAFSQEFLWKAGMHGFFDNNEFATSQLRNSQTMAGVHIAPEVGLGWNKKHRIFVGADLMSEFGSDKLIDYSDLIAYYEYLPIHQDTVTTNGQSHITHKEGRPFRFYMGSFPRKMVLDKYPRMFFQDSIWNYRPLMTGIFWERSSDKYFLNAWLDWTGRQTKERNEAFFAGLSGRYNFLNMFYGQFFSYMYHFAAKKDPVVPEGLHDNVLIWAALGIDLTKKINCFEKLEINTGWTVGIERDRSIQKWHTPQSFFLTEIKAEYKGLGLFNTYYRGERQQVFYSQHINDLYWGDPLYHSTEYNRTDLYVNFIKTSVVNLQLTYSLHFVEEAIYHEQMFTATFDLDNFKA